MKTLRLHPVALLALTLWPHALLLADSPVAQSTTYRIDAAVVAAGGVSTGGVGNLYQNTATMGDTATILSNVGGSGAQNRAGYVASLYEVTSLDVQPGSVNEASSGLQLTGIASYDDATTAALTGSEILWSGFSAPILGINASGQATTGSVASETVAPLTLDYAGVQTVGSLTVLDSEFDNFGVFAGDDLPDWWQIEKNLVLGQAGFADNPDGDDWSNAFELFLNLDPLMADENVAYDHGFDVNGFLTLTYERSKEAAQVYLTVREESSANLVDWDPDDVVVSVEDLGGDTEEVVVRSTNDPATEPRDFIQVVLDPK